jgi:hypothetical protein
VLIEAADIRLHQHEPGNIGPVTRPNARTLSPPNAMPDQHIRAFDTGIAKRAVQLIGNPDAVPGSLNPAPARS